MTMRSRSVPFDWEVITLKPNHQLALRSTEAPMDWEGTFRVEPIGQAATRVLNSGRIRLRAARGA